MKKKWLMMGALAVLLVSCNKGKAPSTEIVNTHLIQAYWGDNYQDTDNGFKSIKDIKNAKTYVDGVEIKDVDDNLENKDVKHMFFGKNGTRVVNVADGYMFTSPAMKMSADVSLSKLRTKYFSDRSVLTLSLENQNPYGDTDHGWNVYLNEWLIPYINDPAFLEANKLQYIEEPKVERVNVNYELRSFDIEILDNKNIEYPYYHIRILRPMLDYINFHLFVLKSKDRSTKEINMIMNSFKTMDKQGIAKNIQQEYELKIPENWSEETKAYFSKLQNQNTVDWGMFSVSMPNDNASDYTTTGERLLAEKRRLEAACDFTYDILPTYQHIAWYDRKHYFPYKMATALAGGNGFNGKPVLQYSYQFTISNNVDLHSYTPMFDILRGEYDDHFNRLARDVKKYGKPVLFRLNNEMNTDWTSYAGILTLLDPDIFVETWIKLYKIFEENGVNNAMWIFNPIARSVPYSNWGDYLNYMPGNDYVQLLGLTSYEMGNDAEEYRSFKDHYQDLYNRNTPYFNQYPAIISEFAAGAGGEVMHDYSQGGALVETTLGRNQNLQAKWVEEMFSYFNATNKDAYPFVKNIKAAIWFSCNDYATYKDESKIMNYLKLDSELTETLNALKEGFKVRK